MLVLLIKNLSQLNPAKMFGFDYGFYLFYGWGERTLLSATLATWGGKVVVCATSMQRQLSHYLNLTRNVNYIIIKPINHVLIIL